MSSSAKVTRPSSLGGLGVEHAGRSRPSRASTERRLAEEAARQPRQPVRHRIGAEIHVREHDRGRRPVVAVELADQHVGAVGGEHDLGQRAGKAGAGLDQRHQRARGEIDALEHALPVQADFARQPVVLVGVEERVVGEHRCRIALRLEHDRRGVELVDADIEDGVVELAREPQRPERRRPAPPSRRRIAGGGASGPRSVMVASRSARANSTDTALYSTPSAVRSRLSGVSAMPLAPAGRSDFAANSCARAASPPLRAWSSAPPRRPAAIRPRACP